MKFKNLLSLCCTLTMAFGLVNSANAADYTFKTDPNPDYYKSTSYEDLYDAQYRFGARNQIDYDIPEIKYGLAQEFLETSLNNPYLSGGIQYGLGGSSGTSTYPDMDYSSSGSISGGTIELPYRPALTVADLMQKDGSIGTVSIKRIGSAPKCMKAQATRLWRRVPAIIQAPDSMTGISVCLAITAAATHTSGS